MKIPRKAMINILTTALFEYQQSDRTVSDDFESTETMVIIEVLNKMRDGEHIEVEDRS